MLTIKRPKAKKKIGPRDHGLPMSLKDFEFVKTEEGYHYELSRAIITVSEVANYMHAFVLATIRNALIVHQLDHPDSIHVILTEMSSKLLIPEWASERHPDLAVYLTKPTGPKNREMWRTWIPEFVIEVVSPHSDQRDYVEKRLDYWTLGVKEYWIVDARRETVVTLKRAKSDWIDKRLGRADVCKTRVLPGFALPCATIFDAAPYDNEE